MTASPRPRAPPDACGRPAPRSPSRCPCRKALKRTQMGCSAPRGAGARTDGTEPSWRAAVTASVARSEATAFAREASLQSHSSALESTARDWKRTWPERERSLRSAHPVQSLRSGRSNEAVLTRTKEPAHERQQAEVRRLCHQELRLQAPVQTTTVWSRMSHQGF